MLSSVNFNNGSPNLSQEMMGSHIVNTENISDTNDNVPLWYEKLQEIRTNVYNISTEYRGEWIHWRMEKLTEENTRAWTQFKNYSSELIRRLEKLANKDTLSFDNYKDKNYFRGMNKSEFESFARKVYRMKDDIKKTYPGFKYSIGVLNSTPQTLLYFWFRPEVSHCYIAYATNDFNFIISELNEGNGFTFKEFQKQYGNLLICVGSDFTREKKIENRGIFRNPILYLEEKYQGFSTPLHGFTSIVAQKYFPEKEIFRVKPIGSIQKILSKQLSRGDGYVYTLDSYSQKVVVDIVDLKSNENSFYEHTNHIKLSALSRIFMEFINYNKKECESRKLLSRRIMMLSTAFLYLCSIGATIH
jgi:hypothetical protein